MFVGLGRGGKAKEISAVDILFMLEPERARPRETACCLEHRSMGLLKVARANTAIGVSPEAFLLQKHCKLQKQHIARETVRTKVCDTKGFLQAAGACPTLPTHTCLFEAHSRPPSSPKQRSTPNSSKACRPIKALGEQHPIRDYQRDS
jgi:hypothetical protein